MAKNTPHPTLNGMTYYHLYNFGVERRVIFNSQEDYDRFEGYLYLLNAVESVRASNFFVGNRQSEIFTVGRGEQLVSIGAYSFVPKNFHILATPRVPGGIGKFMQKLQTAYTMYFNIKYQRQGSLFQSAYKSECAESDDHLKYIFALIHLNPATLFNEEWEGASESELLLLARNALNYRYSSSDECATNKSVITTPGEFPKYFARAKNANVHLRWWRSFKKGGS